MKYKLEILILPLAVVGYCALIMKNFIPNVVGIVNIFTMAITIYCRRSKNG